MNPTTNQPGFVYLIQYGSTSFLKIGFGRDPQRRLLNMQSGSPERLKIISYWEGSIAHEKAIHRHLKTDHYRGEWFKMEPFFAVSAIEKFLKAFSIHVPKKRTGKSIQSLNRLKEFKRSRIKKGCGIKRLSGYTITEHQSGVWYLKVLSRKPDRTSADNSVWPLAGYFNWKSLEASGLLRKEKKTR